jgi:hypothetical protein
MTVTRVTRNGSAISFSQDSQYLVIKDAETKDAQNIYAITYEGEPADGLIISKINLVIVHSLETTGQTVHTTGFRAMIMFQIRRLLNLLSLRLSITRL